MFKTKKFTNLQELKTLLENKKITIVNCSEREFNIRWLGFGVTMVVFGIIMGINAPF